MGRLNEAIVVHRRALELEPNNAQTNTDLANCFYDRRDWPGAIESYRRAQSLRDDSVETQNNLGNALYEVGDWPGAVTAYERGLEIYPNSMDAKWNLGLCQLLLGNLAPGWIGYEQRRQLEVFQPHLRNFSQPMWDGADLNGRTILLHAEQGLGDTLQFVRYAAMVKDRGGRVLLECQPELVRLLARTDGVDAIAARGETLPPFDVHCPLLSLPGIFGTTLPTIPAKIPYVKPDSERLSRWRERVPPSSVLQVGLVWAGRAGHQKDRDRSIPLMSLLPICVYGVRFHSLQIGNPSRQIAECSSDSPLKDWSNELRDFADTAALLAQLDLLITVDTAAAHLAGALGIPTWILLQFAPDWRWMLDRDDSPWYPSARLFRQQVRGDWGTTIASVRGSLLSAIDSGKFGIRDRTRR